MGQPFFVVDIEVPENNNLGIWVLLEKAMELLGSDFKDFTSTRSIQKYADLYKSMQIYTPDLSIEKKESHLLKRR